MRAWLPPLALEGERLPAGRQVPASRAFPYGQAHMPMAGPGSKGLSPARPTRARTDAENPQAVTRFLHEGRLAAKLDHANIVTVYDAGEDNGNYYLAMAYIEGESLDQRLARDRVLPEAEALAVIRAMADALAYAWEGFQLLHRDLKPGNIMVDRRGRVFLMDLGLAKSLGDERGITLSGAVLGTPQYMSPEQAQGRSDLGPQSDVYSLGATLYHLVTGTPPFTGDTTLALLQKHIHEPLPPPRERNPQVTDACSHLLEAMMAKPAERYGDWRALVADIDRVLKGKAPTAQRPGYGASGVCRDGVPRKSADADGPRAPSGKRLEAAVRPGPAGAPVVPPAFNRADLARKAPDAQARQHRSSPKPAIGPAQRPKWLAVGLVAAGVAAVGGAIAFLARPKPPAVGTPGAVASGQVRSDGFSRSSRPQGVGPQSAEALTTSPPRPQPAPATAQTSPTGPASQTGQTGAPAAQSATAPPPAAPTTGGSVASAGRLEGEAPAEPRPPRPRRSTRPLPAGTRATPRARGTQSRRCRGRTRPGSARS